MAGERPVRDERIHDKRLLGFGPPAFKVCGGWQRRILEHSSHVFGNLYGCLNLFQPPSLSELLEGLDVSVGVALLERLFQGRVKRGLHLA
jgi:hypothetical protein